MSLATVDRVLNARPGVRAATIDKVQAAITKLGYVRDTAAANLARRRVYSFRFVLPRSDNEFVSALRQQIAAQDGAPEAERTRLTTASALPFDGQEIVAHLDALDPNQTDGVAVFGPETPSVRDAVTRAQARGIAVVSLVSDLPSSARDHFVGIDNVAAGRTAARLMGRFVRRAGRVLVITGSRLARDHLERRQGFDQILASDYPELIASASIEGRDDPGLIHELLPPIFANGPDIVGVYASSAGNAGLLSYLDAHPMPPDLVVIAHELTPLTRDALLRGRVDAVINQDVGHLVRSCIRVLRAKADSLPFNAAQEQIRTDIYIRENLPPIAGPD